MEIKVINDGVAGLKVSSDGESFVLRKGDVLAFRMNNDAGVRQGSLYEIQADGFAIMTTIMGMRMPAGLFSYDNVVLIRKIVC